MSEALIAPFLHANQMLPQSSTMGATQKNLIYKTSNFEIDL